jgi:hypothetical protein
LFQYTLLASTAIRMGSWPEASVTTDAPPDALDVLEALDVLDVLDAPPDVAPALLTATLVEAPDTLEAPPAPGSPRPVAPVLAPMTVPRHAVTATSKLTTVLGGGLVMRSSAYHPKTAPR